jgi:type IV pilus assembly protein PilC
MKFNYQARTREGALKIGQVEASSHEAALEVLQRAGLYVTFLEEEKKKSFWEKEVKIFQKIGRQDLVLFTRQLAILLFSQTPPVEALHTLASQIEKEDFKEKILKIASEIESGKSFSAALAAFPKIFSNFYISVVKSGELSGNLPGAFNTLADYLERESEIVGKAKSALLYPSIILVTMIIMLTLMLFFVFPELEKVFAESGRELPALTSAVLKAAAFLRQFGWVIVLGVFAFLFFGGRYLQTSEGKIVFDRFLLKLPIVRTILRKIYLSRFSHNLGTLITSGLPIALALEISGQVVGNSVYWNIVLRARDAVRRGESISATLKRYPKEFPPIFSQMVFVGERTGRLDETLVRISNFYKKEVDLALDRLVSTLEPILIVFLGLVVVLVVLTVLLPIYQFGFS